ncbi:hypothetical protein E2C01_029959 [Portunus trituberculatus]|uniref:Uncharacterized protein n=1 Tax=Portunus trituberculatus TaxID=210409 RepID=A0A5B7ETU2_PORTR|nr:hypothetical protein [Portunus trituberculatus]
MLESGSRCHYVISVSRVMEAPWRPSGIKLIFVPSRPARRFRAGPVYILAGSGPQSITLTLVIKCASEGEAEPGCCEVCHGV